MAVRLYDPLSPFLSSFRALEDYLTENISEVYEVQMSFPDTTQFGKTLPLAKTIIHFEIDDLRNEVIGMGDNIVDFTYDDDLNTADPIEGNWHEFNIDVGIWASADTGGTTARLEAYEDLTRILHGSAAEERCFAETDGISIVSFGGGMFFVDSINDLPVWRVRDMTLEVQVAGKKIYTPLPLVIGFGIASDLDLDDEVIITDE